MRKPSSGRRLTLAMLQLGAALVAAVLVSPNFATSPAYAQTQVRLSEQLIGMRAAAARKALEVRKLKVSEELQPAPAHQAGTVIAVHPPVGTVVKPGTSVVLVIGATKGAQPQRVVVPLVTDRPLDDAQKALKAAGLIGFVGDTKPTALRAGDFVIEQKPEPGASPPQDKRVWLRITRAVPVPDVLKKLRTDAERTLRAVELNPRVVLRPTPNAPAGTVIEQKPGEGGKPGPNGEVALVVSEAVGVPLVTNMPLDEAQQELKSRGLKGAVDERNKKRTAVRTSNIVVVQHPQPGEAPLAGGVVLLRVTEAVPVPNVRRLSQEDAEKILKDVELSPEVVEKRRLAANESPPYVVIDQSPLEGGRPGPNGRVELRISVPLVVPSLIGEALDAANRTLAADRWVLAGTSTRATNERPAGTVVAQDPSPNSLAKDRNVRLTIAAAVAGPSAPPPPPPDPTPKTPKSPPSPESTPIAKNAPVQPGAVSDSGRSPQLPHNEPSPPPKGPRGNTAKAPADGLILVPNVLGKNFDDASSLLSNAGLYAYRGNLEPSTTEKVEIVLGQRPEATTRVKSGERVFLTLSRYVPQLPPDIQPPPPPPPASPDYTAYVAVAAVVTLMAFGLRALPRGAPPPPPPPPVDPNLRRTDPPRRDTDQSPAATTLAVRPVPDAGRQTLSASSEVVDWSVSIRAVADAGYQSLEPPQPATREDKGNG